MTSFNPGLLDQEHKYAQSQFEKLIKEYEPRLKNASQLRHFIKKGKVYREVVNQVNSWKSAVVSASTHGASGFEELFMGSYAQQMVNKATIPLLCITPKGKHIPSAFGTFGG